MELKYPSVDAPALPEVAITLGEGWTPVIAPGSILAATGSPGNSGFAPNVQVSVTRHPKAWLVDDEAALLEAGLRAFQDAEVTEIEAPPVDLPEGCEVVTRLVSHVHPEAGRIAQVFVVVRLQHGPVADVLHCVGTLHDTSTELERRSLQAVIKSMCVTIEDPPEGEEPS